MNGDIFNWYNAQYKDKYPAADRASLVLGQSTDLIELPSGIRRRFKAFQGTISHFMLYDRAIDLQDVKEAYKKAPSYKGVIASWDMWKGKAEGSTIKEMQYENEPF